MLAKCSFFAGVCYISIHYHLYTVSPQDAQHFDAHCSHMGTAIKHPVLDRVKLSFVIFDILC